jgi:hypothetical protein
MASSKDGPNLSDLNIPGSNWIDGTDYTAIEPTRFKRVLAGFDTAFEDYTFVDFGSGKGRALLLASEYPFKRILGLEFSPELHRTAEENIRRYNSATQKCQDIQSLNVDFADYALPPEASVLFFFHPCRTRVLSGVVARIRRSLLSHPRRCTSHTSPQRWSKSNCSLPPASWRRYSATWSLGFAFIDAACSRMPLHRRGIILGRLVW